MNWQKAEPENKTIKSPLEQKIEKYTVTLHGYSRNHYLFSEMMKIQESIAKQINDFESIQNKEFEKSDNYETIYFNGKNRAEDQKLQKNLEIQKQKAQEILDNLLSIRNYRH